MSVILRPMMSFTGVLLGSGSDVIWGPILLKLNQSFRSCATQSYFKNVIDISVNFNVFGPNDKSTRNGIGRLYYNKIEKSLFCDIYIPHLNWVNLNKNEIFIQIKIVLELLVDKIIKWCDKKNEAYYIDFLKSDLLKSINYFLDAPDPQYFARYYSRPIPEFVDTPEKLRQAVDLVIEAELDRDRRISASNADPAKFKKRFC